ncbi:MAG: GntR family transcriptional regulator [Bacteroidales bacterium]|jgi:DNA-binding FadR family transcriptional regulator|nr:GntR family transcriptional regulator [Bacteroidales bacterium]
MNDLRIVNHQVTLVDQVEDRLLGYFKDNNLGPGDPIPKELELAEALGVGRSVLREALSRLRMLGLIETRTRRGMLLAEPSLLRGMKRIVEPNMLSDKTLFNILGFRVALEIGMSEMIFQNLNKKHIEDLEDIVKRGVVKKFSEYTPVTEYEFHTKLYEVTGNSTIMEFQAIIRPVSVFLKERFQDYFLPINKELSKAGKLVSHKDLLDFLKKGDKEGFRRGMIDHFGPYYSFLKRENPFEKKN